MSKKMVETKCNPKKYEQDRYNFWMENNFFESGDKTKEPFSIVIPPPNITGKLHLGHAWDTAIQDIVIRRKRMQGFDALWLPGMDHAGIATQAKVDSKLKEQGTSRYEIGREKFLKEAWNWKEEYSGHIKEQWGALGLSLDYNKERFTLDEGVNKAVTKVFIDLYKKGYIYKGERIINWDSQAQTALSNIEVEHKEINGKFYHFKYVLKDQKDFLEVATTRPETMFADQAVMVNPKDDRYKAYVGKEVYIPGTNILIPVIEDKYVDMEFGTGCVKVTPAHDVNDFEVGRRHNLEMPLCINEDGTMNNMAFQYENKDRFECRKQLVKDLEEKDLVVKIKDYMHSVGHSERTGVIVEPRLSKQWFVKMENLAEKALKNQKTNQKVEFVPSRFENTFNRWMEEIQDWCISRQLWWGHRIPAWYKGEEIKVQETSPGDDWTQDEDVLDTWFSSGLWPFSSMGWPEETDDMKRYYPNSVLVTGYDIIFFWVSRMIFQGLEFTKQAPFKKVIIHGLVRDEKGRKMSKSLGNGIDPMEIKEKYGSDSLRYFLTTNSAPGQDLRFEIEKIESSWNYINKIWNISRYVLMNTEEINTVEEINTNKINIIDEWILRKLNETIKKADEFFEKYDFGEVSRVIYNFTWNEFASWYVEMTKVTLQEENNTETKKVLSYVITSILKLLHPFIPFVTEELYQHFPKNEKSITISNWPTINKTHNFTERKEIDLLFDIITSVRNIRNEATAPPSKPIRIGLSFKDKTTLNNIKETTKYINRFCNPSELEMDIDFKYNEECISSVLNGVIVYIPLEGLIDIKAEITRLENEFKKLGNELNRSKNILKNEKFLSKAPKEKVDEEKRKSEEYQKKYDIIKKRLEELK